MHVLKRNPLTWLMLLVTLLACLAVQSLGHKTASGQIYGPQSASWGAALWEAAPRLGLRGLAEENVSAPPVGANERSLLRANQDLANAKRDGECLVQGCIPAGYVSQPVRVMPPVPQGISPTITTPSLSIPVSASTGEQK